MVIKKKFKRILAILTLIIVFIFGYIFIDFIKVEKNTNVDTIINNNLGLLKGKIHKKEELEVKGLIRLGNYLTYKRTEKNSIYPGIGEYMVYYMLDDKLNKYTIKYLLNGAEYEDYNAKDSSKFKNSTINKLKKVLSKQDYEEVKKLIKDYENNDYDSIDKIQDILNKYDKKHSELLALYTTENSNLDLRACFDINKNLDIKYQNIEGITPKVLNEKENKEYQKIWEKVKYVLPHDGLKDFEQFYICTDGKLNELASVRASNDKGNKWIINIDSEDVDFPKEKRAFFETILHEYFHYMSLNDKQVTYTENYDMKNYCEMGMVSKKNSYINDFYNEFWKDILEDRNANKENLYFYERHKNSFVDDYAATSPSEDIAETFSFFVLDDKPKGNTIKDKKIKFFYKYKELVELRNQLRDKIKKI